MVRLAHSKIERGYKMKVTVKNQYGKTKRVKQGFSWTSLFFGALVPFVRGDWSGFLKWVLITWVIGICTGGIVTVIGQIIMCAQYNNEYGDKLTQKGYRVK